MWGFTIVNFGTVNGLKSFDENVFSSEGRKRVNSFHLVISTPFRVFEREKATFVVLFVFVCSVNDTVHGKYLI